MFRRMIVWGVLLVVASVANDVRADGTLASTWGALKGDVAEVQAAPAAVAIEVAPVRA